VRFEDKEKGFVLFEVVDVVAAFGVSGAGVMIGFYDYFLFFWGLFLFL
jgi:hypothetical protein